MLIGGYFLLDSLLFDGIRPRSVSTDGFQANFYAKEGITDQPCVVLVGGGAYGDYWASEFAKSGYTGLSLPYNGQEGLPTLPEEIPLEYFEKAITWAGDQPEVDPKKIIVMGASRNAELSLVIASTLPNLVSGVIAFAPSSVSWSNTVLPYNSDAIKASWTYQGESIPYLPMKKLAGTNSSKITTLEYWESGLERLDQYESAIIPVEKIQGPILLFSGKDDQIWPSARMSDMIADRLQRNDFSYKVENLQYGDAGHLISRNLSTVSQGQLGKMKIGERVYEFEYGGSAKGDRKAIIDAKEKIRLFLEAVDSQE